jgi:hypothetical protein
VQAMSTFQYFTITVGMATESDGEISREEAFKALRDDMMQMVILDDEGATWAIHSVSDHS